MAVVVSNPRISSFRGGDRKPWMLKDFLLDDLGSCSSSGFRSFPRRQCCVAVRSLIEMELRGRNSVSGSNSKRIFNLRSSSRISTAIRRASRAVITAVKLLPFNSPAETLSPAKKRKKSISRSLSKKLFSRSLWSKKEYSVDDCEIERWISSGVAAAEKYQPSEVSNQTTASTVLTVTTVSTTSSTNSDGWSESESEFAQSRSSVDENGVVRSSSPSSVAKEKWSNEDEKEQLSPVSVLSFPDEDEETETKEKLMHKLRRFESLSRVGQVNLEQLLSLTRDDSDSDSDSPSQPERIKDDETKAKAEERLLSLIKSKKTLSNAHKLSIDDLLLDFFQDGLAKGTGKNQKLVEDALLVEAEDWLCGRSHDEVSTGWKVKEKRKVYMKDMEEGGGWTRSNFHDSEKEVVGVQMEDAVFGSLVEELVGEFANLELLNFLLK